MAKENLSVADIDKEIARLEELKKEAARLEAAARHQENFQKAVDVLGRLVDDLRFLEETGYLPPKLNSALTDGSGKFNPGMYIKRPRNPKDV